MELSLEVEGAENITLTRNGIVVGYVKIKQEGEYVRFVGGAVNYRNFTDSTFNGFACSGSITTDNKAEISSADNFRNALKVGK